MRVLLTGARAPATLELARLCAQAGHQVHVADTYRWHVCRGSRLVSGSHRLPAPRNGRLAYTHAVRTLVERERIDVIVPTCEEIFHLATIRTSVGARVVCESLATLAMLHDKAEFVRASERAGLAAPRTHALAGVTALKDLPAGRYILKPRYSRFATRVVAWQSGDPLAALSASPPHGWIAQAHLDGPAFCTWSVAEHGALRAHCTYAVDATAGQRGAAIAFHSARHDAIRAWVTQFLRYHELSGQFAFDFIETGDGPRALECNPRLTSGIHCFRGMPEVTAALLCHTVATDTPAVEPPPDIAFRSRLALLLFNKQRQPGAGLLDASGDPWPALLEPVSWAHALLHAAAARQDPRAWSTADIEWNGEVG